MPAKGADSGVLTGEALLARFTALDTFLTAHQALWKPRPFTHLQLPWETSHPKLSRWLRQRSLEAAENDHHQPWLMEDAPTPFPELAAISRALSAVAQLPASTLKHQAIASTSTCPDANGSRSKPSPAACTSPPNRPIGWIGAPAKATSVDAYCTLSSN